jgi:acetyl esterase/lipase
MVRHHSLLLSGLVAAGALTAAAIPSPAQAASIKASTETATTTTATTTTATDITTADITAADGVVLNAVVAAPTSAGRHPAIVFISSWGLNDLEYVAQQQAFAAHGYVVVSYTARGFWNSGGQIETAGPKDVADLSTVIDWTLAHTAADPARIGVGGISYGAGISLLGAAHDARIKAVVSMSAWSDLLASLYGDQTRHLQSAGLLALAAQLTGRPSPELSTELGNFFADRNVDEVQAWARTRSAASYVDAINANHPAVLIANAYGDTVFPPNSLIDFFGRLTTPKRLELAPGDHAVVEAGGLLGLPNNVWTDATRWFDQYLSGVDTGIEGEPPVQLRRLGSSGAEGYADWAHVTGTVQRYQLGSSGYLGATAQSGWTRTVIGGVDTTADGGIPLLTNGLAALTGVAPSVWLPSVNLFNAGEWVTGSQPALQVRGIPKVHLRVSGSRGTVVAYLYDVDALGDAKLVTHAPSTWTTAVGAIDLSLPAIAYDVPGGHRLALVVDTVDPLYSTATAFGQTLTFSGPSWVDLPLS